MSGDRREALKQDPATILVESGLIDAEFVGAQLGKSFASDRAAAEAAVAAGDISPHPLFEANWMPRRRSWQRSGLYPVVWYVSERRRRNRLSPHPLVDTQAIIAKFPEARAHDYGPLSYWLQKAGPRASLPNRYPHRRVAWGKYRRAAIRAAHEWRANTVVEREEPMSSVSVATPRTGGDAAVTVVMAARDAGPLLRPSVAALQAQTYDQWRLIVVDDGSDDDTAAVLTGMATFDSRITALRRPRRGLAHALSAGVEASDTDLIAFLEPGREWPVDHLARMLGHLRDHHLDLLVGGTGGNARNRAELLTGRPIDLSTLITRRSALLQVDGFDEEMGTAAAFDLVLRLTRGSDFSSIDLAVPHLDNALEHFSPDDESVSVALERHLVDWDEVARTETRDGLLSVILPIGSNLRFTMDWLLAAPRDEIDLLAVGTRLRRAHHILASSVARVMDHTRFIGLTAQINTSATINVALASARGSKVMLVDPDCVPPREPMPALIGAVDDPAVAIAQPVITDDAGLIRSAGAMFTDGSRMPQPFLKQHSVADARRIGTFAIAAPLSRAIILRHQTLTRLRGLDCRFAKALAETDLGLRARAEGLGEILVVPETVLHCRTAYATVEDLIPAMNTLVARDHAVLDDPVPDLLARAGFEVTDHGTVRLTAAPDDPTVVPLLVPRPTIRAIRGIDESPPRLRWVIDIASPAAPRGDRWGDTHFARSLSHALEGLGQDVATDRHEARYRQTRDHDDVVLALRGLDRVEPHPGVLNLEWIISHPDLITPEEVAGFDIVYGASLSWSAQVSRDWGIEIRPLLQCTDARWFHPDRAQPDTGPAVLFVGNSRGVYRYAVRSALAIGAELTLHGSDWGDFVHPDLIASPGVANEEVGELYASAGVVLNDHHLDMRRMGFASNRLFDAAACGARVVSDPIEGMAEIFHGLVLPFHDEAQLTRLLKAPYPDFPDDETRRQLAARVVAEHSFDRRAATLVDDAVGALRARGR